MQIFFLRIQLASNKALFKRSPDALMQSETIFYYLPTSLQVITGWFIINSKLYIF